MLRDRGWLNFRDGNPDQSLDDLLRGYALLRDHGSREEAMVAAGRLSMAQFSVRDYPQALSLVDETITFLREQNAQIRLATALDRRAHILMAADRLDEAANGKTGPGVDASRRLAKDLRALADADEATRAKAQDALVWPLKQSLASLQAMLGASRVTRETLPPDLVKDWLSADGKARVSIAPKADPGDNDAMRRFARNVLAVEPDATSE